MLLFSFLVVFNNFFTSPVDKKNVRLRLALAIPTGVPITAANNAIEMLSVVADKTIKYLYQLKTKQSKEAIYLLSL